MGTGSSRASADCRTMAPGGCFRISGFCRSALRDAELLGAILSRLEVVSAEATDGDLTDVPGQMWSALTKLVLDRNQLSRFPVTLEGANQLQDVSLDSNQLDAVPVSLLAVSSLLRLSLAKNRISSFPESAFGCTALTSLTLEHNFIDSAASLGGLRALEALEVLKLGHNGLDGVPESVSTLTRLQTLSLTHNSIVDVSLLSQLVSLRNLYLNNNKIDDIGPLHLLSQLRVLALQHNSILEMPTDVFANLGQLQTLALNDNMILTLPSSIGCLAQLNRLYLHENLLVTLSNELGNCAELTTLRLEFNELRILPQELERCKFLLVIIAHNNKLTVNPEFVQRMPQLLRLSLEFNPIRSDTVTQSPGPVRPRTADTTRESSSSISVPSIASLTSSAPSFDAANLTAAEFRPTPEFNAAFEHFVETLDFSPSKTANFGKAPAQAKLALMRQHRDAVLRLFLAGRIADDVSDVVEAIAAHQIAPKDCVKILSGSPTLQQLQRLLAGVEEFQDAWFGLALEFGLFDEILRLLHRQYLARPDPDALLTTLGLYATLFDAVWKTVLVTHGSVAVLLLHVDSPIADVSKKVLAIVLQIVRIPEAGVCVLLKALQTRQRMTGGTSRFQPIWTLLMRRRSVAAFRVINALLDETKLADREELRSELLSLHAGGVTAFVADLNAFPEMANELDAFLEQMKEDKEKLKPVVAAANASPASSGPASATSSAASTPKTKKKVLGGGGSKLRQREVPFDVTAMPPLAKIRKKGLLLKLSNTVAKLTRHLVAEFEVDPTQDYRLMLLGGADGKTQVWLDDDLQLGQIEELRIENNVGVTPLFFSLKPVPMSVTFPSGESRTVSLVLASLVEDVLLELRALFSDLPDGLLALAINKGKEILQPTQTLSKQGVEPYTVIFVVVREAAPSASSGGGIGTSSDAVESEQPYLAPLNLVPSGAGVSEVPEQPASDSELFSMWEEPAGPRFIVIDEQTGEVTSASLNKLIERMTSVDTIDLQLTQIFFCTFKSFSTPEEVWSKLLERYAAPDLMPEAEKKKIRVRVCMFVKKWMETRQLGDVSTVLLNQIVHFAESTLPQDGLQDMQTVLLRVLTGNSTEKVITFDRKQAPKPKIPKIKSVEKMTILDLDAMELARQVTLQTWDTFCKIRPNEFFNQNWMRRNAANDSPNLLNLITCFNTLSGAFATLIVQEPRLRKRVVICEKLIDIAAELRRLNNFLMVMSLISAFAQASINRLKFTLEKISDAHKERLKELQSLMNPEKSFVQYRQAYNQCMSTAAQCVPYLGVYLTDLVFVEEATLSRVGPRINIQKHTAVFHILDKLKVLNRKYPLNLEPIDSVQNWLASLPVLSDKQLYEQSLIIEPRNADKVQ